MSQFLKGPEFWGLFFCLIFGRKILDIYFCHATIKEFLDSSKTFDMGPLKN